MIDDETGGLAQALRAEVRPVAVPGHDEQVRLRRGRHHGPFGPALGPANAAQAGLTPAADAPANPASVSARTTSVTTGSGVPRPGSARLPVFRSEAKNRPNTTYSTAMAASQGTAINAANRPKASPLAANASRLVKLDTGSSDAELARCVHAYTCGLARASSRAAVANTTGVSSTTVASRLSTAVVTEAMRNTWLRSRPGLPALARAIQSPQARNSPSSSHRCASTRIAARNPMTGPSRLASSAAWAAGRAPAAIRMTAAGTAANASGQPRGLATAQASTATRAISETVSPATALSASPSPPSWMVPAFAAR